MKHFCANLASVARLHEVRFTWREAQTSETWYVLSHPEADSSPARLVDYVERNNDLGIEFDSQGEVRVTQVPLRDPIVPYSLWGEALKALRKIRTRGGEADPHILLFVTV